STTNNRAEYIFDTNNNWYYFPFPSSIGSDGFKQRTGFMVRAGFSDYPTLVRHGKDLIGNQWTESRKYRSAVGFNENMMYLVSSRSATIKDMSDIMLQINSEIATLFDS